MTDETMYGDLRGAESVCKIDPKGSTPSPYSKHSWYRRWMDDVRTFKPGEEIPLIEFMDILDRINVLLTAGRKTKELKYLVQKVREFYMMDEWQRHRIMQNDYKQLSIKYSKLLRAK